MTVRDKLYTDLVDNNEFKIPWQDNLGVLSHKALRGLRSGLAIDSGRGNRALFLNHSVGEKNRKTVRKSIPQRTSAMAIPVITFPARFLSQ